MKNGLNEEVGVNPTNTTNKNNFAIGERKTMKMNLKTVLLSAISLSLLTGCPGPQGPPGVSPPAAIAAAPKQSDDVVNRGQTYNEDLDKAGTTLKAADTSSAALLVANRLMKDFGKKTVLDYANTMLAVANAPVPAPTPSATATPVPAATATPVPAATATPVTAATVKDCPANTLCVNLVGTNPARFGKVTSTSFLNDLVIANKNGFLYVAQKNKQGINAFETIDNVLRRHLWGTYASKDGTSTVGTSEYGNFTTGFAEEVQGTHLYDISSELGTVVERLTTGFNVTSLGFSIQGLGYGSDSNPSLGSTSW